MPIIHHPLTKEERDVTESQALILTTNPRVPWVFGPLKRTRPTAEPTTSPEGDPDPLTEED